MLGSAPPPPYFDGATVLNNEMETETQPLLGHRNRRNSSLGGSSSGKIKQELINKFFLSRNQLLILKLRLHVKSQEIHDVVCRGTSILGEVRNVEISRVTQQLLCNKSHDFLAVFALAHSKINQIA